MKVFKKVFSLTTLSIALALVLVFTILVYELNKDFLVTKQTPFEDQFVSQELQVHEYFDVLLPGQVLTVSDQNLVGADICLFASDGEGPKQEIRIHARQTFTVSADRIMVVQVVPYGPLDKCGNGLPMVKKAY